MVLAGTPPGGKTVPGGWISTLYIGWPIGCCSGVVSSQPSRWPCWLQKTQSSSGLRGSAWIRTSSRPNRMIIVDGQAVPVRQADIRGRSTRWSRKATSVWSTGRSTARGDRPALRVEHLDDRIDRRAQPPAEDLDDDPLALPGPEPVEVDIAVVADSARRRRRASAAPGPAAASSLVSCSTDLRPVGDDHGLALAQAVWPPGRTTGTPMIVPARRRPADGQV